jgi:hypothetical protein
LLFCPLLAVDVPDRSARVGRADCLALPAGPWIVDAAGETLGVEAHGIRHAQRHEPAVDERLGAGRFEAIVRRWILFDFPASLLTLLNQGSAQGGVHVHVLA